ncbi:hypothetical protein FRB90_002600 [Tulasnella sp. 427]|nr:hypothetical protein FRB90_002600 [Tulasnella sp. 427]
MNELLDFDLGADGRWIVKYRKRGLEKQALSTGLLAELSRGPSVKLDRLTLGCGTDHWGVRKTGDGSFERFLSVRNSGRFEKLLDSKTAVIKSNNQIAYVSLGYIGDWAFSVNGHVEHRCGKPFQNELTGGWKVRKRVSTVVLSPIARVWIIVWEDGTLSHNLPLNIASDVDEYCQPQYSLKSISSSSNQRGSRGKPKGRNQQPSTVSSVSAQRVQQATQAQPASSMASPTQKSSAPVGQRIKPLLSAPLAAPISFPTSTVTKPVQPASPPQPANSTANTAQKPSGQIKSPINAPLVVPISLPASTNTVQPVTPAQPTNPARDKTQMISPQPVQLPNHQLSPPSVLTHVAPVAAPLPPPTVPPPTQRTTATLPPFQQVTISSPSRVPKPPPPTQPPPALKALHVPKAAPVVPIAKTTVTAEPALASQGTSAPADSDRVLKWLGGKEDYSWGGSSSYYVPPPPPPKKMITTLRLLDRSSFEDDFEYKKSTGSAMTLDLLIADFAVSHLSS